MNTYNLKKLSDLYDVIRYLDNIKMNLIDRLPDDSDIEAGVRNLSDAVYQLERDIKSLIPTSHA